VCAYKTRGNDGRYGRCPSSSSLVVAVSSMSSLSRYNDAYNDATTSLTSSTRHGRVVITMSKRSHRRRVVVLVNVIVTDDDDDVPRGRVVDNAVDEDVHDNVIVISRGRRCQDYLDVVTTTRQRRQRRCLDVDVVVVTTSSSSRRRFCRCVATTKSG